MTYGHIGRFKKAAEPHQHADATAGARAQGSVAGPSNVTVGHSKFPPGDALLPLAPFDFQIPRVKLIPIVCAMFWVKAPKCFQGGFLDTSHGYF